MHIELSIQVHAKQADEVFMRVEDKSKKLSFEKRLQLWGEDEGVSEERREATAGGYGVSEHSGRPLCVRDSLHV